MNGKNKRGSVFTLLLRNFILFTLLLVFVLTVLVVVYFLRMVGILASTDSAQLQTYGRVLSAGQYEQFPAERLLGAEGFFWVLDENNGMIYQSAENQRIPAIDTNDLRCIPDYELSPSIDVRQFHTQDGSAQTAVSVHGTQAGEEIRREYIWDEENTLVYQSGDLPTDRLTQTQAALLTDTLLPEHNLRKYLFQTEDGAGRVLLLASDRNSAGAAVGQLWSTFFTLLGIGYVLVLLLFVLWMNRRIKKPLRLLSRELNRFEQGDSSTVAYRGPREFVEIFDSFNGMAERLRRSEDKRRQLEAARQKMLADISHDLKTPITVVRGYAKALCDGVIPPDEQSKYLGVIEQKAEGLDELINTFHEYSKLEHPDYTLPLARGDICNYLRDYVAERYDSLEVGGNLVEAEIPEVHIPCMMDGMSLGRALDNIVNNAVKHNPGGITILFALERKEDRVQIRVADSGSGIPAELRATIFEPFVVGEASRSRQGSGLGLSISRRIVEAHGGTIRLADPLPRYATVYEIELPIANSD